MIQNLKTGAHQRTGYLALCLQPPLITNSYCAVLLGRICKTNWKKVIFLKLFFCLFGNKWCYTYNMVILCIVISFPTNKPRADNESIAFHMKGNMVESPNAIFSLRDWISVHIWTHFICFWINPTLRGLHNNKWLPLPPPLSPECDSHTRQLSACTPLSAIGSWHWFTCDEGPHPQPPGGKLSVAAYLLSLCV